MISSYFDAEALQFIDTPEAIAQMADFVGRDIRVNYTDAPILIVGGIEFREGDYVVRLAGSIVKVEREAVLTEEKVANSADYPQVLSPCI